MNQLDKYESEGPSLIKKRAEPVLPEKNQEIHQKGLISFIRDLLAKLKGYTIEDIKLIKDSGVRMIVEEAEIKRATALKLKAEARKTDAEAMMLYAKAEKELQDAAQLEFDRIQNETIQSEIEKEKNERISSATERLEQTIVRLRMKGGNLYLDGDALQLQSNNLELAEKARIRNLLRTDIDELNVSVRVHNMFRAADFRYISDLVIRTENELLKFRNFGREQLKEVILILNELGLHLGMEVEYYLKDNE